MATDKKRVILYVDQEVKADLEAVADKLGCSVSRLCGDVLEASLPSLKHTASMMEMARKDPQKAVQMMRAAASTAQADLLDTLKDLPND